MDYFDAVQVSKERKMDSSLTPGLPMNARPPHASQDGSALDGSDDEKDSKFNLLELQRIGSESSNQNPGMPTGPPVPLVGTSDMDPPPEYVKLRLIGAGAYGEAWLCKHSTTGATTVVKTMNIPGMSKKELSYAQSEIQCLASVNHTNIIRFFESQCDDKVLIIAMEFADAGDLRKHIKARHATQQYLTESEAMFLFIQVAMAIQHIHNHSMLHRDIKSANVLIMSNGLVKLADFGFSRQYEDTVSGAVAKTFCGTPYYLAPELWKNRRYSNKAEVWSLGVFLYELLALDRPFQSPTLKGLFDVVVAGKYAPLPSQFSKQAKQLVATLLDLDAARRPTSLEIFQIPYVQEQLEILRRLVQDNSQIPPETKAQWEREASEVLAKARANPIFEMRSDADDGAAEESALASSSRPEPGHVNLSIAHAGPVRKLAAMPRLKWSDRYLILERGMLHLCDSAEHTENRRTLALDDLQSACAISEQSAKRRFVFAVHTRDSKCTWLQAPSEEERDMWIAKLQQAMGVL